MYVNKNLTEKMEIMVCSKDPENINIKMDNDAINQVPTF